MARRHHRLLSSLLAAALLSSTALSASAATVGAAESGAGTLPAKYYSTNPTGVGKAATITIDGDASDWSEDMLIAQGAAWDVANHWKGGHENCVLDTYALYAAWDDSNLYVGWQMVNTTDTWANPGDGPLSDGGRVLDVPLILALSLDSSSVSMSNKNTDGGSIWGQKMGLEFTTHVDRLFYMSGKPGLGEPSMFKAVDASGNTDYKEGCVGFAKGGIEYNMATTCITSSIWGLDGTGTPEDVFSESSQWVDFKTKSHDTKYDSFYEMKIPFSTLGITKDYLTSNGIGAMLVATRGESALDCIPYDPSMLDNATGDYTSDPSTSKEKDDVDTITVPLAAIGNGTINPTPPPTPQPVPGPDPTPDSDTETPTPAPDSDTETPPPSPAPDSDSPVDLGTGETAVTAKASKGDTVEVTLTVENAAKLFGVSSKFTYDSSKLTFVKAEELAPMSAAKNTSTGEVRWNVQFGDGSQAVTQSAPTDVVKLTFTANEDIDGKIGTNKVNDSYDYDFNSLSLDVVKGTAKSTGGSPAPAPGPDPDEPDNPYVEPGVMEINAKASAGEFITVTFSGDLSKFEGVSSEFTFDAGLVEYVDSKALNGIDVAVNQTSGLIRWNSLSIDGTGNSDLVTIRFKVLKDVDGKIGTNSVKEVFDKDQKDADLSLIQARTAKETAAPVPSGDARKIEVVAEKGDRVGVSFKAKDAKAAAGILELVDFDTTALKYNKDAASSLGVINTDASNGRVAWSILFDMSGDKKGVDLTSETEVAVLSFTAMKDIKADDNVLTFLVSEFYDFDDKSFDAAATTSAVASIVARGDGKVPVTAKKGNYVKAYCKAIDAEKALGIVEQLNYDNTALQYLGYTKEMGHFAIETSEGAIRWSEMFEDTGTDLRAETDLVVFTFYALKDIASSDSVLSYKVEEFYDYMLKDFDTTGTTMVYAVTSAEDSDFKYDPGAGDKSSDTDTQKPDNPSNPTDGKKVVVLFGDVDEDKNVTATDALVILRTGLDMDKLDEVPEIAADVDDDEVITASDALSVLRFSINFSESTRVGKEIEITIKFKN